MTSTTRPRIAVVTGASGFLGRAFSAALRGRGYEVRGIDVRPGPQVVVGDVTRPGAWTDVLDGADLVVHAAAVVQESGDPATFWRVNVEGTRTVIAAAERAEVGRVLHLSSIVVHGRTFPDGVDETGPVRMTGNPYTDTKVAAEHQALLAAAAGRVPVTIVRPGDCYGPHSSQWTVRPVELLRRNLFVLVDGGRGIITPTYVDDLVDGALAVADVPQAIGEVFHVTGGAGVEARDFFGHYARMLDKPMRALPAALAVAMSAPVDAVARSLGVAPPLSARTVEYITHPGTYSIAKIERMVGWRPKVSLDDGMVRTRLWLTETGLVPEPGEAGEREAGEPEVGPERAAEAEG